MKSSRVLMLIAGIAGTGAASYDAQRRSDDAWRAPRVVTIDSAEKVASLTPSWLSWFSDAVEGQPQALLLRDADYVSGATLGFRYAESDGLALKLTFSEWSTRLGDTTVAVDLDPKEGRDWLRAASQSQLGTLRMVSIPKDLDADLLSSVKRLAAANPSVDLAFQSDTGLTQVLPLFRPRAVFLGDDASVNLGALANQPSIDTLLMNATEPDSLGVLSTMPRLSHLILGKWETAKTGPLPPGLTALKTFVVVDSDDIKDLSSLANVPAGLEELSLLGLENLTDISGLKRFTALRTLLLWGDERLSDLSSLASHQQLRWVSLPPAITQEQFVAFTNAHANLEILDLMGTEHLTNLSALSSLKHLQGLLLDGSYRNVDAVQGLTTLRFVGISKKTWEASPQQVAAIRKALPDAIVVRVSPLCLGSGWILLFVPLLALLAWLRRREQPRQLRVG